MTSAKKRLLTLAVLGLVVLGLATGGVYAFQVVKGKSEFHRQAAANLADAVTAMDEASKALAAGDKDKAAAALAKAQGSVKEVQTSMLASAPGVKK